MAKFLKIFGAIYSAISVLACVGGAIAMWAISYGDDTYIGYGFLILIVGVAINLAFGFMFIVTGKTSETVDDICYCLASKARDDDVVNRSIKKKLEEINIKADKQLEGIDNISVEKDEENIEEEIEEKDEAPKDYVNMKCPACGGTITIERTQLKEGGSIVCSHCNKKLNMKKQ